MEKAQAGMLRTDADVKNAFDLAAEDARQHMRQEAAEKNLPTDERLATVELTSLSLDRGASKLRLIAKLTTDAGTTRTVYLPVPVAIR
jgi:glycine cleavage system pyridoxal-binding protein P